MQFKSYPNSKTTPNRKTRKGARRDVFMTNKKAAKLRKKAARALRQETAEAQGES